VYYTRYTDSQHQQYALLPVIRLWATETKVNEQPATNLKYFLHHTIVDVSSF